MNICRENYSIITLPVLNSSLNRQKSNYEKEDASSYMNTFYTELIEYNKFAKRESDSKIKIYSAKKSTTSSSSEDKMTFLVWKILQEIDKNLKQSKLANIEKCPMEKAEVGCQTDDIVINGDSNVDKQETFKQTERDQCQATESLVLNEILEEYASLNEVSLTTSPLETQVVEIKKVEELVEEMTSLNEVTTTTTSTLESHGVENILEKETLDEESSKETL